jgi:predicted permease
VAPAEFTGPEPYITPEVYVPVHSYAQAAPMIREPDFLTSRKLHPLNLFAKLRPGAAMAQGQAETTAIMRALAAEYPETNRDRTMTLITYRRDRIEREPLDAQFAMILMGITGMVLLIACANVANLLLARGTARVKEIAIRTAIGAGRGVLIRQLLTESMILALAGGAAGIGVGYACIQFLSSIKLAADLPLGWEMRMDTRLLVFALALSVVTGIVFGLVPALRATRMDLSSMMKAGDQGPVKPGFWRGRLAGRNLLVVAQLALSVVLLVAAGMFVRGFGEARKMNPGFRVDHTLLVSFNPSLVRYDEAKARVFYHALMEDVRRLPGVEDAALGANYPFAGNVITRGVAVNGYRPRVGEGGLFAFANIVDDHFFDTTGTKLTGGRAFDARDTAASPRVVILNEEAAKRFFPGRDALGQQFRLNDAGGPEVQVVGIAKTGKYLYWAEPAEPFLWMPFTQDYDPHVTMQVHTRGDPAAMAESIRDAVRRIDPDMPVFRVQSMEAFYEARAMLAPRLTMQIVTMAGSIGLLLAIIGLYGVVAYAVGRRTREIGIRMAIGAKPLDVLRMVLTQGLGFTFAGLGIGLFAAYFASRALAGFVVGVSPHDPGIFAGVALILALVMLAACWLPARRAARIDPLLALRQD